jgi:hypothetical protein
MNKDYNELTPEDFDLVLKSHGCIKASTHDDHAVYILPGGTTFLVVTDMAHAYYARNTARLVEKILEVFGPRTVYDLWGRVERRNALKRQWEG